MSSPIAKSDHSPLSRRLIGAHQKLSHGHRVDLLAETLAAQIRAFDVHAHCIDIGCGDMQIADAVAQRVPGSTWRCFDLYPLSAHLQHDPRWQKYVQFDGQQLPLGNREVDVALFCDVLHHMPEGVPVKMLAEAGRVARRVVVKDHLEYGWWSRQMLRAMDFVGNWAYGVSVPDRYFDLDGFRDTVAAAGLRIESLEVGVDLYSHLPVLPHLLKRKWHFVATLSA